MQNSSVLIASGGVTGVIIFVKALINLVRVMRWLTLEDEQWNGLSVFLETTIPIGAVWVAAWYVSRNTTSQNNPTDKDGTILSRPGDVPVQAKMEKMQEEAILIDKVQTRGLE